MATKQSSWVSLCFFIISACFLGFGAQVGAQSDLEKAIIGTWKLVSIEQERSGEVQPDEWMGKKPIGIIMYDSNGYMSVQFMRDPQEKGFDRYYAYFGTYKIEPKEGTEGMAGVVEHHMQGSLMPQEVGQIYMRTFKISGNTLIISTFTGRRLTFERVEKRK